MRTTLISLALICSIISVEGQSLYKQFRQFDIQVYLTRHQGEIEQKIGEFAFDAKGKIQQINRGPLYPFSPRPDGAEYVSQYFYSPEGQLVREDLYEIVRGTKNLFRVTNIQYVDQCTTAICIDQRSPLLGFEIVRCPHLDTIVDNYKKFRISDKGYTWQHGGVIKWFHTSGKIDSIALTPGMDIDLSSAQIIRDKDTTTFEIHINDLISRDSIVYKNGRPFKLKYPSSDLNWNTKFTYTQDGMLKRIVRRGRKFATHELGTITYEIDILSGPNYSLKRMTPQLVRMINEQLIEMYFPPVRFPDISLYLDSRRYIYYQG